MMGGLNRPNPRKLSELFMKGPDGLGSIMNRTALFAFFGKLTLCYFRVRCVRNVRLPPNYTAVDHLVS